MTKKKYSNLHDCTQKSIFRLMSVLVESTKKDGCRDTALAGKGISVC